MLHNEGNVDKKFSLYYGSREYNLFLILVLKDGHLILKIKFASKKKQCKFSTHQFATFSSFLRPA